MEISSRQIATWSATTEAQSSLPRLIRRLIHHTGSVTQIAFPAGDSINQPGWDGEIYSELGNSWVPKGKSFWELSCEAAPGAKAAKDYKKRTASTPEELRKTSTLVVVTARTWRQKLKWCAERKAAAEWGDIRAYDADDLEEWLEQAAAVKLRFGEELGISGFGVESIERYWLSWAEQTDAPLSRDAFIHGREATLDRLKLILAKALEGGLSDAISVRADSAEEAAAFAVASIANNPAWMNSALVITDPAGWRFVEQNEHVKFAIAARPELAERPVRRSGTAVIIPYSTGDMIRYFNGVAGAEPDDEVIVERPDVSEFEKALIDIGIDEGDAKRLSVSTGRSWSVFRRQCARNPAIRRPAWLAVPQASALSTLCLLGGWSAKMDGDRAVVSELAGQPYEQIEKSLRELARLDDSPILVIGDVWKAKSSLELLSICGERITRDELERFFAIAQRILSTIDPALELPDEQRYAAQIYGKQRPESGLLLDAICDTLVKLSVRGGDVPSLAGFDIESRVAIFVRNLLHEAEADLWLSLSNLLPGLAEAAPNEFLSSVEASLASNHSSVTRLISESRPSSEMGRCWHAGLLWALERLAWAPERLTRVTLVLAQFAQIEIKGFDGNSPRGTLLSIFRVWLPQTSAPLNLRISAIDILINRNPVVAFDLLDALVTSGSDMAIPAARPSWREDDSGSGRGVSDDEICEMSFAAADRLINCARGNASRVARLLKKIAILDKPRADKIITLAEEFRAPGVGDQEKEILRNGLRDCISLHTDDDEANTSFTDRLSRLYGEVEPQDLIIRHCWLFRESWPDIPDGNSREKRRLRPKLIEEARIKALGEIYEDLGMGGIEELARLRTY